MTHPDVVPCWVYKSDRRQDTYIYLGEEGGFEKIPPALRDAMGDLEFVLQVDLEASRKLPNAEAARVMEEVSNTGFYLQLPPKQMPFESPSDETH